jgi:hypothetical protein
VDLCRVHYIRFLKTKALVKPTNDPWKSASTFSTPVKFSLTSTKISWEFWNICLIFNVECTKLTLNETSNTIIT